MYRAKSIFTFDEILEDLVDDVRIVDIFVDKEKRYLEIRLEGDGLAELGVPKYQENSYAPFLEEADHIAWAETHPEELEPVSLSSVDVLTTWGM